MDGIKQQRKKSSNGLTQNKHILFTEGLNTKKYFFRYGRQSTQSVTYDSNLSKYNNMLVL
jgi:hypothetical protein